MWRAGGQERTPALHDFDLTQRRKGRKEQISLAFLASLRENRELLNSIGKASHHDG
jgi:hypothetical protein